MNYRERFLNVMNFKEVDRIPNYELGLWPQTCERWFKEGLPQDVLYGDFFSGEEFFKLDRREFIPIRTDMIPSFEEETLEETDRYIVKRHSNGITTKALKEGSIKGGRLSMDQYLKFSVENEDDFENIKKRYNPKSPIRYPSFWDEKIKNWKNREHPLCLLRNGSIGFYSNCRTWMGTENLSIAFYDQPKLVHKMMDFIEEFLITLLEKVVKEVEIDYFNFFEDFAFKTAPLISPSCFKEFIMPHYKRVINFLKSNGVKSIWVDSDGNIEVLIPQLLECGVNCIWPLEIAAGMDPVKLRKEYAKDLVLCGGIDKRELSKDKKSIEKELYSKIPKLIETGGYIPTIDHAVPPDISYENFMYYIEGTERLRVYALKSKKDVLKFVVQLEFEIENNWKPIVRYDTAHSYAHKDIIHADGHIEKQPLYFENLNSAFTFAIEDIKLNWQWYKFAYIKEVEQ